MLTDRYCLKVNRMPVWLQGRDLGAVVTVRDRTEHVELLRELDSVATLTDALRGQQHEHANRMHTVAGLLELDRPTEAASYLEQVAGDAAGWPRSSRTGSATPLSWRGLGLALVHRLVIRQVATSACSTDSRRPLRHGYRLASARHSDQHARGG